ncbi:MAG: hypothetical protein WKH64_05080 [Chloroflexia bacterium]
MKDTTTAKPTEGYRGDAGAGEAAVESSAFSQPVAVPRRNEPSERTGAARIPS